MYKILPLIIILSGCMTQNRVADYLRKHPELQRDTVVEIKHDTHTVVSPPDTVTFTEVVRDIDTILYYGGSEIRYVVKTDTITKEKKVYIRVVTPPDTIRFVTNDTIIHTKTVVVKDRALRPLVVIRWAMWIIILLILIRFIIKNLFQ